MNLKIDKEKYDELQIELLNRIMNSVKDFLVEDLKWRLDLKEDIDLDVLCDLAENIGFAVTSTIDGCDVVGDKDAYIPTICFKKADELISNGGTSYMHEMAMGSLEEWLFEQDEDE
jgi:hypothetical protein